MSGLGREGGVGEASRPPTGSCGYGVESMSDAE